MICTFSKINSNCTYNTDKKKILARNFQPKSDNFLLKIRLINLDHGQNTNAKRHCAHFDFKSTNEASYYGRFRVLALLLCAVVPVRPK